MTGKYWLALGAAAVAFAASPLFAQQTRTVTIDTPRVEGTKEITRDREEGTLTRDTELTRKSDSATATASFERQRTEDGVTRDRTATDFEGRTATSHYERERTENGWSATGERVQRDGDVIAYRGRARVGEHRVAKREVVTRNGERVAARSVVRPRRPRG